MKNRWIVALLALSVPAFVACQRDEVPTQATETEIAGTTNPMDVNPVTAQTWVDDVTIGHELGADGAVVVGEGGDDFAPGQPVHLAIEAGDAPAGAAVMVVWFGPNEARIGEETKNVTAGQKYLNFQAPDTSSWAVGDYRAEVWTGDEKVNTQQFQIVAPGNAGR